MFIVNLDWNWGNFWESLSAVCTALVTIVAVIQLFPKKPKLKLLLEGPTLDCGRDHWHLRVENTGSTLKEGALFLVGYKENSVEIQMPMIRFEWPYESTRVTGNPLRSIVRAQFIDLFSAGRWKPDPKMHLCPIPTRLVLPNAEQNLDFAVQIIGENYQGEKQWIRLSRGPNQSSTSSVLQSYSLNLI